MTDTTQAGTNVTLLIDAALTAANALAAANEASEAKAAAEEATKTAEKAATAKAKADKLAKAAAEEARKAGDCQATAAEKLAAAQAAAGKAATAQAEADSAKVEADKAAAVNATAKAAAEEASEVAEKAATAKAKADKAAAAAAEEDAKAKADQAAAAEKAKADKAAADKAATALTEENKAKTEADDAAAAKAAAAKAAADRAAAAKAALLTSAKSVWPSFFGVGFFGLALGVLTSLTTTTGITATLIGLIFTFVGASLLSWFKRDAISPEDRSTIAGYTGAVGLGVVLGLFAGFGLRYYEEIHIRPELAKLAEQPAKQVREEIAQQLRNEADSLRNQIEKLTPADKVPKDTWQDMLSTLKRIEDAYAKLAATLDKPADKARVSSIVTIPPRYIFNLQAGATSQKLAAAEAAGAALKWDESPENKATVKLTRQERECLESFKQALLKDDPSFHLSPQVSDAVGAMLYRTPESPISGDIAKTLKNYLTPVPP